MNKINLIKQIHHHPVQVNFCSGCETPILCLINGCQGQLLLTMKNMKKRNPRNPIIKHSSTFETKVPWPVKKEFPNPLSKK